MLIIPGVFDQCMKLKCELVRSASGATRIKLSIDSKTEFIGILILGSGIFMDLEFTWLWLQLW